MMCSSIRRAKCICIPRGGDCALFKGVAEIQKWRVSFAVKNNVPVLPMVFVFPKPQKVKLVVGKPIYLKDVPGAEGLETSKADGTDVQVCEGKDAGNAG